MHIEVLHDSLGNILSCYCADTLPAGPAQSLFTVQGGVPAGCEQARINIDTMTALEIDGSSGQKAVYDPATGEAKIVRVERSEYVMKTFKVDTGSELQAPAGTLPANMRLRALSRKA